MSVFDSLIQIIIFYCSSESFIQYIPDSTGARQKRANLCKDVIGTCIDSRATSVSWRGDPPQDCVAGFVAGIHDENLLARVRLYMANDVSLL